MQSLKVAPNELPATKQRAIDDAKSMQIFVVNTCKKLEKDAPKYQFMELIGKGSYGRVYKAKSLTSSRLVAIKIIDIEQGDVSNPRIADTYSDLLKEINALKLLGDSGARNINHVIDAFPLGQSMWMVTEYCAGGSVSTLMRPNAPSGLHEKWIIPILREVAEALKWVHRQGIIHRDIKGANVLITEDGGVQLCDFGVAGLIASKVDKRTTVIGTPHWMAPELFNEVASYGTEVDIWAFGAMVHEIASGQPPNVAFGMDFSGLGNHLKHHCPRLEGDAYSPALKDMAAICLQSSTTERPNIEQIQKHPYIFKTETVFPTSSLSQLVRTFKLWESRGGDRRSLFSAGGAQGLTDSSPTTLIDEWNFTTTVACEQHDVFDSGDAIDRESNAELNQQSLDNLTLEEKRKCRRRRPPELLAVKAPLEKLFDPNTLSNYDDNSRTFYGRNQPALADDLVLRNETSTASEVRESLIDLDASLGGGMLSQFADLGTMKPVEPKIIVSHENAAARLGQSLPNSPVDTRFYRRTRDWKFPNMDLSLSANLEGFRFPFNGDMAITTEGKMPACLLVDSSALTFAGFQSDVQESRSASDTDSRASIASLIDLDLSLAQSNLDYDSRPSTSHSGADSIAGSDLTAGSPFDLEKHASLYLPCATPEDRTDGETESFVALGSMPEYGWSSHRQIREQHRNALQQLALAGRQYTLKDFERTGSEANLSRLDRRISSDSSTVIEQHKDGASARETKKMLKELRLPHLPNAPAPAILQDFATQQDIKNELSRLISSFDEHLCCANELLDGLATGNVMVNRKMV